MKQILVKIKGVSKDLNDTTEEERQEYLYPNLSGRGMATLLESVYANVKNTRGLVKACENCKEIIVDPKLGKGENEICGKCEGLVERYEREHKIIGGFINE
jgi:hypothetical protein